MGRNDIRIQMLDYVIGTFYPEIQAAHASDSVQRNAAFFREVGGLWPPAGAWVLSLPAWGLGALGQRPCHQKWVPSRCHPDVFWAGLSYFLSLLRGAPGPGNASRWRSAPTCGG